MKFLSNLQRKHKYYFLGCVILFVALLMLLTYRWGRSEPTDTPGAIEQTINQIKDAITPDPPLFQYVQVMDSCGPAFDGGCVNVRSGPSVDSPAVFKARNGLVLKVSDKVTKDNKEWYKLSFDEWLRYPERVKGDLYISAEFVKYFKDAGNQEITANPSPSTKRILVDRSEQKLYAYENDVLFMEEKVSTGIELTPTPRGNFTVFRKTPSRYMQGPIPGISDHYYDLPGVPWNLYFTEQGAVIHGAYWHNSFGTPWSNGCVNLPIASAEKLYKWADVGTKVTVRD